MKLVRALAVAFSLLALSALLGCGPDLATDPTTGEPADNGTTQGALVSATWDATLGVPLCGALGASCDTGASLVVGRATLGPEPHASNTIHGSCPDGDSGVFHTDESVDQITVTTADGTAFAAGKVVNVAVTVWAYTTSPDFDYLDVYYAADATSPVWNLIGTFQPGVGGATTLYAQYTLPAGGAVQAVRAAYRYSGVESPCTTGSYDDRDDLAFAVGSKDATPPAVTLTSPMNGATVSGTISLSANASDNIGVAKVQFYVDGVLKATDTTSPYSVSFNTTTVANGSHTVYAKAFDTSGNTANSAVATITVNNVVYPELLTNGGFEGSSSPWVLAGTVAWTNIGGAHSGSGLVSLAGVDGVTTASVYQQVIIPSGAQGTMTFWLNVTTQEGSGGLAYDYLYAEVRNTSGVLLGTVGTYSNLDMSTGYVQKSVSLASWRGQTVRVQFRATTDGSLPTTFKVDDVSVK